MTLTLLAIFLAPLYLKIVLDPKGSHKAYKAIAKSTELQMTFSLVLLLLALMIFSQTGLELSFTWESLLAWLGLITFVKAVAILVPGLLEKKMKMISESKMPILGFVGLLMVLALVYVDTQLI